MLRPRRIAAITPGFDPGNLRSIRSGALEANMEVTRDIENHIKRWKFATEQVADLKQQLNKAECEMRNSETALAKQLLPGDAKANEKFCVWYGDSLIAARHNNGSHFVELRTRGRSWNR